MKNLLFPLFLIFSSFLSAQENEKIVLPIDSTTNLVTYSGVVQIKDRTAKQLYSNGKAWFTKAFGSGKATIDFEDNVDFKIIGKGKIHISVNGSFGKQPGGYVNFTISLFFKDGRYKYIFSSFYHEGEDYQKSVRVHINSAGPLEIEKQEGAISQNNWFAWKNNWNFLKEQTNEEILSLISSLNQNMTISINDENF